MYKLKCKRVEMRTNQVKNHLKRSNSECEKQTEGQSEQERQIEYSMRYIVVWVKDFPGKLSFVIPAKKFRSEQNRIEQNIFISVCMHAFPVIYAQCRYFNFYHFVVAVSIFLHLVFVPEYSIGSRIIIHTHTQRHTHRSEHTHKQETLSCIFQSGNLCKYFGQNINKKATRKPKSTWNAVHSIEFHAQHEHHKHTIRTHTCTHAHVYHIHHHILYCIFGVCVCVWFALHVSNILWLLAPSLP